MFDARDIDVVSLECFAIERGTLAGKSQRATKARPPHFLNCQRRQQIDEPYAALRFQMQHCPLDRLKCFREHCFSDSIDQARSAESVVRIVRQLCRSLLRSYRNTARA